MIYARKYSMCTWNECVFCCRWMECFCKFLLDLFGIKGPSNPVFPFRLFVCLNHPLLHVGLSTIRSVNTLSALDWVHIYLQLLYLSLVCIAQLSCWWDKVPNTCNLKKKRFNLVHSFGVFSPWLAGRNSMQKDMAEGSCSLCGDGVQGRAWGGPDTRYSPKSYTLWPAQAHPGMCWLSFQNFHNPIKLILKINNHIIFPSWRTDLFLII